MGIKQPAQDKRQTDKNKASEITFDFPDDPKTRESANSVEIMFERLVAAINREMSRGTDSAACMYFVNAAATNYLEKCCAELDGKVEAFRSRHEHFGQTQAKFNTMFGNIVRMIKSVGTRGGDNNNYNVDRVFVKLNEMNGRLCAFADDRAAIIFHGNNILSAARAERLCNVCDDWFEGFADIYSTVENMLIDNGSMSFFAQPTVDLYMDMIESDAGKRAVGDYNKELCEYVLSIEKCLDWSLANIASTRDLMSDEKIAEFGKLISVVNSEFDDTKKLEKKCKDTMFEKMNEDVCAIKDRFNGVLPKVPQCGDDGMLCYPFDDGNTPAKIPREYLARRQAVATVALSSVFAANSGKKNAKNLFSLKTFKEYGLVADSTKTAVVVDDGYSYEPGEICFGVRKICDIFDDKLDIMRKKKDIKEIVELQEIFYTGKAFKTLRAVFGSAKR